MRRSPFRNDLSRTARTFFEREPARGRQARVLRCGGCVDRALYYGPQRWPLFAAHPAPALAWDEWIPFQPAWALAYQSVFIVHTLALWLPRDPAAVKTYARNVAAIYAGGASVFWLYPTLSPRPRSRDHSCTTGSSARWMARATPCLHCTPRWACSSCSRCAIISACVTSRGGGASPSQFGRSRCSTPRSPRGSIGCSISLPESCSV